MKYNKKNLKIKVDFNNMMVGAQSKKVGFKDSQLNELLPNMSDAFNTFKNNRGKGMMGWTELPYNQQKIVNDILITAKEVRNKFEYFVVLGIGGSALGPIAVFQALCHLHHNDLPRGKRKAPKFYVEDNIDPDRMFALFDVIDIEKTMFNVITKSGSTSETMSQYLIINRILKAKLGDKAKDHIITTTSETLGELIKISKREGYKTFFIPDDVGGRFSELCPVGLLPAAVLKVDIEGLLRGAQYMDEICSATYSYKDNPAMALAVLQYLAIKTGRNISVMMPYSDRLKFVSDWYAQLWAESLGKAVSLDGKTINVGQTPVKALGVTDQHSQVQLYTEGPDDKVITFIKVEEFDNELPIPQGCETQPNVNFLCGHTMNELIAAECSATEYAITKAGKLNNSIILSSVNAFTLGQLLQLMMIQTAYAGALLNIDTFNQPGVEEGKKATYALLGKPGFEEKRKELNRGIRKARKYII